MPHRDYYADTIALLKEHGAVLVRQKKHQVWELPDGRHFTIGSTPSDSARAGLNSLRDLRRFLGLTPPHKDGERREKKPKKQRQKLGIVSEPVPKIEVRVKLSEELLKKQRPSLVAEKLDCSPVYLERYPRTGLFAILLHLCGWPR